ncbi:MAG: hypothetical protein ILA13_09925 [Eubacterium sp.]|nr:hypothetical protein [Eubacterium sp.]
MIPKLIKCNGCGYDIKVATFRKFVKCPCCDKKEDFAGFKYRKIDWSGSEYANVKSWQDCPACRSKNMFLGPEGKVWKCPDCGYKIKSKEKNNIVFWFCDDCEAYLNIQKGFNEKTGKWRCTECGYVSDVTEDNII